jgi:hypothetical protein
VTVALVAAAALALAAESPLRIQPADLPGLLWSTGAACPDGADVAARQCRGVRSARARLLAGRTFVMTGDASALERRADGFTVRGCLDCAGPTVFVTGGGGVTIAGGRVLGPILYEGPGALPPAATVDLYVRLGSADRWTQEGHAGFAVETIGYRVYDACRGEVYAAGGATTSSASDVIRSAACAPATSAKAAETVSAEPATADIKAAMDAVAPDVLRCLDRYGVPGTADVFVEIGEGGRVTYAETRGAFFDSPTGACVTSAVMKARFPRYPHPPVRIHYPFLLR